eukprot:m.12808 g.12808  ORF g.12808 m.12808 type:complete len:233 (+) comp9460_c0_seq1:421-1119(+)
MTAQASPSVRKLYCVVVGDNGSGKTCLLARLENGTPPPQGDVYKPVLWENFWLTTHVNNEEFQLRMVDVNCDMTSEADDTMHNAYQCTRMRPLTLLGLGDHGKSMAWGNTRKRKGLPQAVAILCFADANGLQNVENIYLPEIREHLDQCPWVLLRLRDDTNVGHDVGDAEEDPLNIAAHEVVKRQNGSKYCRCSALTGVGTSEAVDTVVELWATEWEKNGRNVPQTTKCSIM